MVGLTKEDLSTAFHVGIISAIGPSFSAMISTIAMSSIMGAPVTYQRVSIIASASTELRACQYTAEASGYELAATGMPMEIFSACLWVMAINGCGWLVFVLLFNDKMTTISNKITGGSAAIMSAFATAAILGTTTYMGSGYLLGTSYQRAALFSALIFSVIMDRLIVPKAPKLKAWNMGQRWIHSILMNLPSRYGRSARLSWHWLSCSPSSLRSISRSGTTACRRGRRFWAAMS
jgi:preprotein translocase subunit SecG